MRTVLFFGLLYILNIPMPIHAQGVASDKTVTLSVNKPVEGNSFLFTATTVQPMWGGQRNINGEGYIFKIHKGILQSELPYFGVSTVAPMNTSDIGMKFTSKDFTYSETSKKDRRQITIRPKDVSDIQEIFITVFTNGSADVRINSVSRQSISYRGKITPVTGE